jgi:hypothetical protein
MSAGTSTKNTSQRLYRSKIQSQWPYKLQYLTLMLTFRVKFDDFIVTHIQQTLTIHFTGNFMPWHRWFVYIYEKALRDECGYTGYQPVSPEHQHMV